MAGALAFSTREPSGAAGSLHALSVGGVIRLGGFGRRRAARGSRYGNYSPTPKKICGVLSERCESEAQTEAALTAAPVGLGTCRPYGTTNQRWSPMPVSASPNWRR